MAPNALIAVVDDDTSFRAALEGLLRSLGYRSAGFASATAFLASDVSLRADCIVSDINMPGMTGIELKRQLDARGSKSGFIVVSAMDEEAVRRQATACGAVCFLVKPFQADAIAQCVDTALGR